MALRSAQAHPGSVPLPAGPVWPSGCVSAWPGGGLPPSTPCAVRPAGPGRPRRSRGATGSSRLPGCLLQSWETCLAVTHTSSSAARLEKARRTPLRVARQLSCSQPLLSPRPPASGGSCVWCTALGTASGCWEVSREIWVSWAVRALCADSMEPAAGYVLLQEPPGCSPGQAAALQPSGLFGEAQGQLWHCRASCPFLIPRHDLQPSDGI